MALPKVNTPRYELTLPSSGQKVSYRPYLIKEEKIIMMASESNDENQMIGAVKSVIESCTDGAINANKITMFDLEYIFIQLRAKSVGETSAIKVKCDSCSEMNEVDADLSKVKVDVPNDSEKGVTKKLTEDISVLLKYPDVDAVVAATEAKSEIDAAFDLIGACLNAVYQGDSAFDVSTSPREEVSEFIESLNNQQFGEIQNFVETMPTAELGIGFKCTKCGENNDTVIRGLANFFS